MAASPLRSTGALTALSLLGVGACHGVTLGGSNSREDGSREGGVEPPHEAAPDVGVPPDARCGDAPCAYADIGLPEPTLDVYTDNGPTATTAAFRALVAMPMQNQPQLAALITGLYTPGSPTFRKYLSPTDWADTYAPPASSVQIVTSFLASFGMNIERRSTNGLLLEFTGTAAQFNRAFQTTLHDFTRQNPESGQAPVMVYGVTAPAIAPVSFVRAISSIVSCDLAVPASTLEREVGAPTTTPPGDLATAFTPAQIAAVYGVTDLAAAGATGAGVTVGIVGGGAYGEVDIQSFWKSFGIVRADPVIVETMEEPPERVVESTVDTEWSGAMAPGATLRFYEAPDARDTSLLYTFHEAIGRAEAQIVTDSFSAREDSEADAVAQSYDAAAMEAAALGITVLASSGDGGEPDIPSVSTFVTAVGGTALTFDDGGTGFSEVAWSTSGSGSTRFGIPAWQAGVVKTGSHRETADLSLNAGPQYWWNFLGKWRAAYGTSFSSPTLAGIFADVQSARNAAGKPALGYLNSILYTVPAVHGSFRDITAGGTSSFSATVGWDPPTGWGVVQAKKLAEALP